jgi:hypothetical protein
MKPHSMRPFLADRGLEVVAAGQRVWRASRYLKVRHPEKKVSIVRWPTESTVADCRPDGLRVFGPRAFVVESWQLVQW